MTELMIIEQVAPIVKGNFEEVKKELKAKLDEYKKLVVTEESLSFCKSERKHLAGLRKKIDTYRKDIKKEMNIPIVEFEEKCKDLIAIIEETEAPILEGIEVFDNQRREAKKVYAIAEISRIANELGLSQKYIEQLQLVDKYMNLTAKEKDVTEDIENRAKILKMEQEREKEVLDTIAKTIERVNKNITQDLSMRDFLHFIKSNRSLTEIIKEIENKAQQVKESESKVKQEAEIKAQKELEQKIKTIEADAMNKAKEEAKKGNESVEVVRAVEGDKIMCCTLKLTGTKAQLEALRKFVDLCDIKYDVI